MTELPDELRDVRVHARLEEQRDDPQLAQHVEEDDHGFRDSASGQVPGVHPDTNEQEGNHPRQADLAGRGSTEHREQHDCRENEDDEGFVDRQVFHRGLHEIRDHDRDDEPADQHPEEHTERRHGLLPRLDFGLHFPRGLRRTPLGERSQQQENE